MEFCLKVANQFLLKEAKTDGKNVACSPFSLNLLLNMAAVGSTGGTLEQFLHFLGAESAGDLNSKSSTLMGLAGASEGVDGYGDLLVSTVNGAWVDLSFPFKPSYIHIVQSVYKAQARTVDFLQADEVKKEVNAWCEKETEGLIKELITNLSPNTKIILANALYFKATWESVFYVRETIDRDFYLLNGEKVSVPFMTTPYGSYTLFGSFDGFKLVQLPYQKAKDGRKFSMHIFLPNERDGLQNLIQQYESNNWFSHQMSKLERIELDAFWIPKFKFSFKFEPIDIISKLGLVKPFGDELGEFTEMSSSEESEEFYIGKMIQKCYIQVDEEGTEAAAVTELEVDMGFSLYDEPRPPKPTFVADHPFMFIIQEETTGAVLYTGAVVDPLQEV